MDDCIFCRIARGDVPSHKVWESENHLAFLNITPNMEGFTVVISKEHLPSNVQTLEEQDYQELFLAGKRAAEQVARGLGVDRCAIIAEGTGVDHAHLKLIPLIGLAPGERWEGGEAHGKERFERYEGYVTTKEGPRADDEGLARTAEKIRRGA